MRTPDAEELLGVWECGRMQAPATRALELLAAACPETHRDSLTALSIGQRDAQLLALRERLFGPRMSGIAACPGCGVKLELPFDAGRMRAVCGPEPPAEISLSAAGYQVRFRLPNAEDAIAAASEPDAESGGRLILRRCLLESRRGDLEAGAGDLPGEVVEKEYYNK